MIIYKVTNRINGKVYIGQTKRSLEARWWQHCSAAGRLVECGGKLLQAIRDDGRENFTVEQIDVAADQEEANRKEAYWIGRYNSVEDGYNTSPGVRAGTNRRRVLAVEDGLIFDTIKAAAVAYGISGSNISQVVDKPHLTSAGVHWVSVKKV